MTALPTPLVVPTAARVVPAARVDAAPRHGDRYLVLLGLVLLGYALMGKGFAYLGLPPLFVGELTLALGLLAVATVARRIIGGQLRLGWPLVLFMAWGAFRTFPFVGTYGMDALRDAVTWGYGLFAVVVMVLLAERPDRLATLLRMYRRFIPLFLVLGPALSLGARLFGEAIPQWPWAEVRLIHLKGGDYLVHLAGIFGYLAIVGTGGGAIALAPWVCSLLIPVSLLLNLAGRAGILSFGLGVGVVALFRPYSRPAMRLALVLVMGLFILWASSFSLKLEDDSPRDISFEQLYDNLHSVFADSDRSELSGSKGWRLQWWTDIVNYTVNGPYFWTGKGYGINLASADGYQVTEEESLRSPHNGHMTILARGGVPGALLWVLVQGYWATTVLRAYLRSRRMGQTRWAALLAFLMVYWAAFMANTAFDVFIEGPMGGIWFWCIYGTGLAAVRIRDVAPHVIEGPRAEEGRPCAS